jgi:AAA+ superfamily predicted ATPase
MALNQTDKNEIERMIRKEIKDFLTSTDAHKKVIAIIKKELRGKDMDDRMVEIATKSISELFKTLWTRKSFWEGPLKSLKP